MKETKVIDENESLWLHTIRECQNGNLLKLLGTWLSIHMITLHPRQS